jgi:autotransporter-associated beta strand protein
VLTGSIDGGGTASAPAGSKDQFIFNGFSSASFNNVITNFDLLHATGNADVGLSAASYSFDQVQIDAGASLAFIDTALTAPSGIINNGALTFSNSTPNAFGGPISGNGDLFKEDVGTFTLSGTNTYSGATAVVGGTLQAGAPNTFSPNSAVTVSAGTVLDLNDFNQTVFGLTNTGLVDMGAGTVGTQLTTTDYVGGGTIAMNTVLDAGSSSDTLVITGTLSGATILDITNFGGAGAYTTGNGILVVNASSATIAASASFTLAAPLVVGSHEYTLHKGGVGGSNPQNWYLRNPSPRLPTTAVPTLNPVALVLLALALTGLAFWRRRRV